MTPERQPNWRLPIRTVSKEIDEPVWTMYCPECKSTGPFRRLVEAIEVQQFRKINRNVDFIVEETWIANSFNVHRKDIYQCHTCDEEITDYIMFCLGQIIDHELREIREKERVYGIEPAK